MQATNSNRRGSYGEMNAMGVMMDDDDDDDAMLDYDYDRDLARLRRRLKDLCEYTDERERNTWKRWKTRSKPKRRTKPVNLHTVD